MKCPICNHTCSVNVFPSGQQTQCYICGYRSPGYMMLSHAIAEAAKCPCCGNACSVDVSPAGHRLSCYICGYQSPGYMR